MPPNPRTPPQGVISWAAYPEKMEEDKHKVREYVKEELFERVVFLWSKASLEPGGVLHHDYLKNCRARLADGKLVDATDQDAETYMNLLWRMMVKDNCYHEWLSHKCSSRYQAVQDKFESEYHTMSACLCCNVLGIHLLDCNCSCRDVHGMQT